MDVEFAKDVSIVSFGLRPFYWLIVTATTPDNVPTNSMAVDSVGVAKREVASIGSIVTILPS